MCQMIQDLVADGYNEGFKGGLAEGWEGGMAKGKAEGARATAWNLRKLGMDSMTIAGAVGYDEETVEKWLKEYKDSIS